MALCHCHAELGGELGDEIFLLLFPEKALKAFYVNFKIITAMSIYDKINTAVCHGLLIRFH